MRFVLSPALVWTHVRVRPVADSVFVQFMADAAEAAVAAGIDAAQIVVGTWEQSPAKEEFYAEVAENGFYLWVEPPKGRQSHVPPDPIGGDFDLIVRLIGSVPADATPDWTTFLNTAAAFLDALANTYPWYAGHNRAPVSVDMALPEVLRHEKPYIVVVKFTLAGRYIAGQAASPTFSPVVT